MALTFVYISLFAAFVAAANDWTQPCLNGECEYDLPTTSGPSGTVKIWGPSQSIGDITTAGGWTIVDCDPNQLEQHIRLVCHGQDGHPGGCGHFTGPSAKFVGQSTIGKIVRLPEECGGNPFGLVTGAGIAENQDIPARFMSKLARRDGTLPTVQSLKLGMDFSAATPPTDPTQQVRFAVQGANVQGAAGNITQPPPAGRGVAQQKSFGSWINSIIDVLKKLNEWDVDDQHKLAPLSLNKSFNLFNRSISCPPATAGVNVDVAAQASAVVAIGIVAAGTFIPPMIDDFVIVSTLNADLYGQLSMKASVGGTLDSGTIPLYEMGLPGLSFPGILEIGPSFGVYARTTASLDVAVDMIVGLDYKVNNASFTFPPRNGATGFYNPGDYPLSISATPGISVTGVVAGHIIPTVNFGVKALFGTVKADVFLDLDASASMKLTMGASVGVEAQLNDTRRAIDAADEPVLHHPRAFQRGVVATTTGTALTHTTTTQKPAAVSPSTSSSSYITTSGYMANQGGMSRSSSSISSSTSSTTAASPAATLNATDTSPQFGGCFEIDVGFSVNVGASASFFEVFSQSTALELFSQNWTLLKECFGSKALQTQARRSLDEMNTLSIREPSHLAYKRDLSPRSSSNLRCSNAGGTHQQIASKTIPASSLTGRDLSYALY